MANKTLKKIKIGVFKGKFVKDLEKQCAKLVLFYAQLYLVLELHRFMWISRPLSSRYVKHDFD